MVSNLQEYLSLQLAALLMLLGLQGGLCSCTELPDCPPRSSNADLSNPLTELEVPRYSLQCIHNNARECSRFMWIILWPECSRLCTGVQTLCRAASGL